jgi:hypothetical protein
MNLTNEKLELIKNCIESKRKDIHSLKIYDIRWLYNYYSLQKSKITKKNKIKMINNLIFLRNKICKLKEITEEEECPICLITFPKNNLFITDCLHHFCEDCIIKHFLLNCDNFCPLCRSKCNYNKILNYFLEKYKNNFFEKMIIIKKKYEPEIVYKKQREIPRKLLILFSIVIFYNLIILLLLSLRKDKNKEFLEIINV